jgi:soluble lytic murein transglycosylase
MTLKLYQNKTCALAVLIGLLPFSISSSAGVAKMPMAEDIQNADRAHYVLGFLGQESAIDSSHFLSRDSEMLDFINLTLGLRLKSSSRAWAKPLAQAILTEANRYHIDPLFLLAQMDHESQFNPHVVGSHGEIGLFQIKPSTARVVCAKLGIAFANGQVLHNPILNLRISVAYLMVLRSQFKQYNTAFVDAYNLGPNRLLKRIKENQMAPSKYSKVIRTKLVEYYRLFQATRVVATL